VLLPAHRPASECNNAQPEVDSPPSAALQGSATASRAIAMLFRSLSFWSGDLPPAARMLIFVLSFYLTGLLVLLMTISYCGTPADFFHSKQK
jgi:hypothetical protein